MKTALPILLIATMLLPMSARAEEVHDNWKLPSFISQGVADEIAEFYKAVGTGRPWEFWWRWIKKYAR